MTADPRADLAQPKRDRDEVFVEYTKSICPLCKAVVDAQVNIRDGKVFLRKRCRDHGEFKALQLPYARPPTVSAFGWHPATGSAPRPRGVAAWAEGVAVGR